MMSEDDNQSGLISRRSVVTHIGTAFIGWFISSFLHPFNRTLTSFIGKSWLGREPQIGFGYSEFPDSREKGYRMQIVNGGEEAAENLSFHLGFKEQITEAEVRDWVNAPPAPDIDINITDTGIARINVEFLRRDVNEYSLPIIIDFSVEEGTKSGVAHRIDNGDTIFIAYRYAWTFLGERYYEATEHHVAKKN